jgi:mRNA interferase RelE/StbE
MGRSKKTVAKKELMYSIEFVSSAQKDVIVLPLQIQERIETEIDHFQNNPRPNGCKKLKGLANMWRVRIGNYRILYKIDEKLKHIIIYRVLHRKDVYR